MDLPAAIQEKLKGLFADLLGIEFAEVGPDRVVGGFIVRPNMCTLGGVLHGGAIMALADTLGAVGAFVNLPEGARTTTIESKTNFLAAASAGSRVIGESTPIHRGKLVAVWQTQVRAESGKLIALVIQTQLVIPTWSK
jgi:1,4-dihydroxy-2-naphthoyl-CoA hydrolase